MFIADIQNATPSFANVISRAKSGGSIESPKVNEAGKKGKKPSRVLLSTAGGRRYWIVENEPLDCNSNGISSFRCINQCLFALLDFWLRS